MTPCMRRKVSEYTWNESLTSMHGTLVFLVWDLLIVSGQFK